MAEDAEVSSNPLADWIVVETVRITINIHLLEVNVVKYINVAHTGKYCPHSSLLNHFNVI